MTIIALAVTVGLIATSPVQSEGWEYARWRMTPSQVVSASNGLAYLEDAYDRTKVKAPFRTLGLEFRAHFRFGHYGLDGVRLRYEGSCERVTAAVQAEHGEAQVDMYGKSFWAVDGNRWDIFPDGGLCQVMIDRYYE